jgi:hypothetical protein
VSSWQITNFVALLVLPPGCLVLAAIAACCWAPRSRRGLPIAVTALAALYALSTPYLAGALLRTIEPAAANPLADAGPGAIVVLGGGTYFNAPEYGGDTVGERTLARVRYGAALYRATGKPLLVTGGSPEGRPTGEARQMQAVLTREFNVPVRWMEEIHEHARKRAPEPPAAAAGRYTFDLPGDRCMAHAARATVLRADRPACGAGTDRLCRRPAVVGPRFSASGPRAPRQSAVLSRGGGERMVSPEAGDRSVTIFDQ